jgi:sarcosine oxidase
MVVIIGAGILGAALAQRLARRGWRVTLVEQYVPGHTRAASGGRSRILRLAHGSDAPETRSAWLSRRLWREIERETRTGLFSEVGMAWFAPAGDSEWEQASRTTLVDEGVAATRLSPAEAMTLFPDLRTDDLDHVLYEPQAGILQARKAVVALVRDAVAYGAELVAERAEPDGDGVVVATERLRGNQVVWACGAWTPLLFPGLVQGKTIQQDVFYFEAPPAWVTPAVPAWGEWRERTTGTGDFRGHGFKVGADDPGPLLDPDSSRRPPVAEQETAARAYLARRFPALADAPLVRRESCQTVILDSTLVKPVATLGGEVRLLRHPEHERVWLLGDGSGHAFKHAPAIAAELERLLAQTLGLTSSSA